MEFQRAAAERAVYIFLDFSVQNGVALAQTMHALYLKLLHKWISLPSEAVTQAGKPVHFRKPLFIFSHRSILQGQCFYVVFIGERHATRQQVQSRHWSYLLCQETKSPRESFMQHCDVLLGLWNILWLIPGFHLHSMTQRHRVKKKRQTAEHSSQYLCACVRVCSSLTVFIKLCDQITNSLRHFSSSFPFPVIVAVPRSHCTSGLLGELFIWTRGS